MSKKKPIQDIGDQIADLMADKARYASALLEARFALEVTRKLVRQHPDAVQLIDDVLKEIKHHFERPASGKVSTPPSAEPRVRA